MPELRAIVVGAGLAGCEAAWQLLRQGIGVTLYDMKPQKKSPAHQSDLFAELVCSNSFRSDRLHNAVGLLKEEMRRMGSLVMEAADASRVPAGGALAVDRDRFSGYITRALTAGAVVVSTSVYALHDPRNAPAELRTPLEAACRDGGSALFVSGIDPGWGNDVLPVLISGLGSEIEQIRCQEIFDYSTYDAEDSVRDIVGMGRPMDYEPPMVAPGIPSMVWGGQVRMIARALGVELDEVREVVDRRPLDETVTTALGDFAAGTQGALAGTLRRTAEGAEGGEGLTGVSVEKSTFRCRTPRPRSSWRITRASGQPEVSARSAILRRPGSSLFPVPMAEMMGMSFSRAVRIRSILSVTESIASMI